MAKQPQQPMPQPQPQQAAARTTSAPSPAQAGRSSSPTGAATRRNINEDQIRQRAYQKWQAAGCPSGDGCSFWFEAERELREGR